MKVIRCAVSVCLSASFCLAVTAAQAQSSDGGFPDDEVTAGAGGCGDGLCDPAWGEDCASCAVDCGGCSTCGDGVCDTAFAEDCSSCDVDCGPCCGDAICDIGLGEDCATCSLDCGDCSTCGDGICDTAAAEDCSSCDVDCGPCCGNAICDADESCESCSIDCGDCSFCGDGVCDTAMTEDCASCEADCGSCGYCGDGYCDPGWECCDSCVADCGTCGGEVCDEASGDICDYCPEDPSDPCSGLPVQECPDPEESGPHPDDCPEACTDAYASAGFPAVYDVDPAECSDCTQSFTEFCDSDGDGQVDADKAGVGVTFCYADMPCDSAGGGGTPAACPCPCGDGTLDEATLPLCEEETAVAAATESTCAGGDGRNCDFNEKPRLCQRYSRTNNDFDENACNMISDKDGRKMAFRTAVLDVDLALDASACECNEVLVIPPPSPPRWRRPFRRCGRLFPRIFQRCRPRVCPTLQYECKDTNAIKLTASVKFGQSPWGTDLLEAFSLFDCTPDTENDTGGGCPGAPAGTIDVSVGRPVPPGESVKKCENGVCKVDIEGIKCGAGNYSRRLCLMPKKSVKAGPGGDYAPTPVGIDENTEDSGFGSPTVATLDINFSIARTGCDLSISGFTADFHEYAYKKPLDHLADDAKPCLKLFAQEVPKMTVCERKPDGSIGWRRTLDHLVRIQNGRQDGDAACEFSATGGFPPRTKKGFEPPLTDQLQKDCAKQMWEERLEESGRCVSDPGCSKRFCWCGYNHSATDKKCDAVMSHQTQQREFLEDFCGRCHQRPTSNESALESLDLDTLHYPADGQSPWDEIEDAIREGRMPKGEGAYVPQGDKDAFLASLAAGAAPACVPRDGVCTSDAQCCKPLDLCVMGKCKAGCMLRSDPACMDPDDE